MLGQAAATDAQELTASLESWKDRAQAMATQVERIEDTGQCSQMLAGLRLTADEPPAKSADGKPAAQRPSGVDFASQVRYYNFGIALIRGGHGDQGATALDRVGNLSSNDPTMLALADQANLALAFHLLDRGQAASAIPVLGRIRSEGPYANRAILALGWAWLLPSGDRQMGAELGDERTQGPPPESFAGRSGPTRDSNLYQRYRIRPFARASIPAEENARLERALAAWAELIDRDADDDAVLEGWLAIADALDRFGAHADALHFRERALTALDAKRQRLRSAIQLTETESWIEALQRQDDDAEPGGNWQLRVLPTPSLARYLGESLASSPFQVALHDLHDYAALQKIFVDLDQQLLGSGSADIEIQLLRQQLASWQAELKIDRQGQRNALRAMALKVLATQADRINQRLADTRLMIARQFDKQAGR